jgi:hypothetical protein
MKKAFRLLGTNTQDKIEEHEFSVELESDGVYRFYKYSYEGQDFSFAVDIGETMQEFADNILEYHNGFDVSEEAYYWLDNTGHGANGAPYDMRDVYNDMEECKGFIYELYEIIKEFC